MHVSKVKHSEMRRVQPLNEDQHTMHVYMA